MDDSGEGPGGEIEKAEAFFQRLAFFTLISLVNGFVPCFPLNHGPKFAHVRRIVEDALGGDHLGGGVE